MKRILALILTLALTLALFACGSALPQETETPAAQSGETAAPAPTGAGADGVHDASGFSAGFGRKVITPNEPVPLAGYGRTSHRFHKNVLDDIMVTCVAVSDGETTALLITQDIIRCNDSLTDTARKQISKLTGVPVENILISSTHTHSSVDPSSSEDAVVRWKSLYYKQIKAACEEAIADLDAASLEAGRIQTEHLVFVRRCFLKDGTFLGPNSGTSATADNPAVSYESEADRELQLIRFVRKNQPDIVIANAQGHPTRTGGSSKTDLSADYIYPFRKHVEEDNGVKCAFFLGASGNQNTTSFIKSETSYTEYMYYGKMLAGYANELLQNGMEPVESGKLLSESRDYTATARIYPAEMVGPAREIQTLWNDMKTDEAKALCKQYGISSPYAAGTIISSQSYKPTTDIPCCAVSFGDVSFVTAAYEMFSTVQLALKAATPFKMTFVLTCSQEAHGYIPTEDAFPHGGYEVDTTHFVQGTAEGLRDTYLDMLNTLYAEK